MKEKRGGAFRAFGIVVALLALLLYGGASMHGGVSGSNQASATSPPDSDGTGKDRGAPGPDPADHDNGCGNDADREDDNNGHCKTADAGTSDNRGDNSHGDKGNTEDKADVDVHGNANGNTHVDANDNTHVDANDNAHDNANDNDNAHGGANDNAHVDDNAHVGDDSDDNGIGSGTTDAVINVSFTCTAATVTTTGHELSNVVLRFADGDQKFDGLTGYTGTFSGTGAFAGKTILAVFVKAGSNHSGAGPGYGQQFNTTATACSVNTGDDDDNVLAVTFDCTSATVTSSEDTVTNVVLVFAAGEQRFDGLTGTGGTFLGSGTFAGAQVVAALVKTADADYERFNAPAMTCQTGNDNGNDNDTNSGAVVAGISAERPAPAAASRSAEVLGVQAERTPAAANAVRSSRLAATGVDPSWMAAFGLLLLAFGVAILLGNHRRSDTA